MHFQYNVRYVAFCAAPYYVLVGHGLSKMRPAVLRALLVVLLLGYTANSLRANYFMPRKEGFRAAGSYISQNRQPGDCGVFFPGLNLPSQWSIEHPDPNLFRVLRPRLQRRSERMQPDLGGLLVHERQSLAMGESASRATASRSRSIPRQ